MRTTMLIACLLALPASYAHAQAVGAATAPTTPQGPGPGTAMPHPAGRMPASGSAPSLERYTDRAAARSGCGTDAVVWVDATGRRTVDRASPAFGRGAHGFYTCRASARAQGLAGGGR